MAEFHWVAQYDDDTKVFQRDSNNNPTAYKDIDKKQLKSFFLYPIDTRTGRIVEGAYPVFHVFFDGDGESLIWTRRHYLHFNGERNCVHIVAKKTENKTEFVAAIYESGRVEIRSDFVKDDPVFDEVTNNG